MKKAISYQPLAISHKLFNEAKKYIPGGVNSPVRSFQAVGGYPLFVKKARGSKIYGECKREFIDYCLSWGALILGHSHPKVVEVLKKTIDKGSSFGTATVQETELAQLITEAIPSIEKLRLTNSGTEAVMGAIRLARAYTGKNKLIKFAGCYHGHADYLLNCPGIPKDFSKHTLVCPYNDIKKVQELVEKHKQDIAAIIVEPVAANMGVVLPKNDFLKKLREITQRSNLILIFDEVITGFRLTYGGAQKLFGVKPDLTCLGKIMGGGLPCGAFGGIKEIMDLLAPEGEVYQAGTFSGNPLTVNAGLITLKILSENNPYSNLGKLTQQLCENIRHMAGEYGFEVEINSIGSLFSIFFDTKFFKRFYQELLKEGIYLSPSPWEANFLSTAHTVEDINKTLMAVAKTFRYLTSNRDTLSVEYKGVPAMRNAMKRRDTLTIG